MNAYWAMSAVTEQLMTLSVKQLKAIMDEQGVSYKGLKEKVLSATYCSLSIHVTQFDM